MEFDDLFEELEAKFESMQLRQRAKASQYSSIGVSVTLQSPLAIPGLTPRLTQRLVHASIGSDCITGFDETLGYWVSIRFCAIAEFVLESVIDIGMLGLTTGDFSFDSLLGGLDLPCEVWLRRNQDSMLLRGRLTAFEESLLRVGYGAASRYVPAQSTNAIVIALSSINCG